jgi:rSAM/selenodomain-associated transferase 2
MRRPVNLFAGIPWGQPGVLRRTLALADGIGVSKALLDPLTDLDTPEDLARETKIRYPSRPYLSVVIPTLNEERTISGTIAAARSADAEIIVSDGGSTDRTRAIARARGARVLTGQRGRAVQQNRGADTARGEVLLFLHADTRLPPDYVGHIFATLMDRRTVLGAFRFATDLQTPVMRWIAFGTNLRAARLRLPYGDQGLFMSKSNFLRIGGFPDVPIAEDLFLVRQMNRIGRVALAPAAATTSARRWQRVGPLRTTLINTAIAGGCLAGIPPSRLAPLYRKPGERG